MTDTTEKKTTPDSTRRYRLAIAALKAVEDASDHQVHEALGEFQSFFQLYSAAKLREVDARMPMSQGLKGVLSSRLNPHPGYQEKFYAQETGPVPMASPYNHKEDKDKAVAELEAKLAHESKKAF